MRTRFAAKNNARLPRELLHATPRPTALTAAGKALRALVVLLLAGAAVGGVLLYDSFTRDAARAGEESVAAHARITAVRRSGSGGNRRFRIDYRYSAAGAEYTGTARLRGRNPRLPAAGDAVAVRYLRSRPQENWLEGRGPGAPPWALLGVVPGVLVLSACALAFCLRRQRRLLEEGRPALATVDRVSRRSGAHGEKLWRIEYHWTLYSGATRSARYDAQTKRPPEPGMTFPIVYDREEPQRHARYPFSLVRVEP